ncbi:hypothetical protein LINGRAHAP2_LOCUS12729 [Linum grandiflorum]
MAIGRRSRKFVTIIVIVFFTTMMHILLFTTQNAVASPPNRGSPASGPAYGERLETEVEARGSESDIGKHG